jgi:hypothetical protein
MCVIVLCLICLWWIRKCFGIYGTVFIKSLKWFKRKITARPIFMQLASVQHDQKTTLWKMEFMAQFLSSLWSGLSAKKLPSLFLCNLHRFNMTKKQHFENFSCVGLCNPPSGSLCLHFCEMAESSHEQSARATILNSNRPKPQQIAA